MMSRSHLAMLSAPGVGPGVASRVVQVSSGYAPGVVPGTGVVLGVVSSVGVV